jgi:short-subunit dehydrogenase
MSKSPTDTGYWSGKRAVVTGASSGLGKVLAESLVSRGARVLLIARGEAALLAVANQLQQHGGDVATLTADVTQSDDVQRIAKATQQELGGVDLLCHAAGRSMRGEILATTPEQHRQLWEVNFLAIAQVTQHLADPLVASGGHVVLIGSLASKVAPRYMGAYPASKFPVAAYAQQLRLQWGTTGPHVLLVCSGPFAGPDTAGRYDEQAADLPPAASQAGGGARIQKLDPQWLADQILQACERRQIELIVPRKSRLLFALSQISPRLGDWLLRKTTAD